jgi:acyl-CoA thioesterase FadM
MPSELTDGPPRSCPQAGLTHHVAMVDVDLVQINFSVYFRWMDLGYGALLRELGRPLSEILDDGHGTPAVDARCSYLRPVGLDDRVEATAWIERAGRTSFTVAHRFQHDGETVAIGTVTHVWIVVGPPAAAVPLPDWVRRAAAERS